MQKLFIILLLLFAVSCNEFDNSRSMEVLEKMYPNQQVITFPDLPYRYLIVDTCNRILYVKMMGSYDEVTSTNVLKQCSKN